MKIEIETSAKNVEMANFMLARAVEFYSEYPSLRDDWDITEREVEMAATFRRSLLKALLINKNPSGSGACGSAEITAGA